MNSPRYRNDINGLLPQLKQTVQDICNYLPSQRLASNTLQIDEHRAGTLVNMRLNDVVQAMQMASLDETITRYAQQLHFHYLIDIDDSPYKQYAAYAYGNYEGITTGAFFSCYYLNALINGQPCVIQQSEWPPLSGHESISAYITELNKNGCLIDENVNILSSVSDQYEWRDDSYINGVIRLKLTIVSGFVYADLSGMMHPPIGYMWDIQPEMTWTDASVYHTGDETNVLFRNSALFNYLFDNINSPSAYYIPIGEFKIYDAADYLTAIKTHQSPNDFTYSIVFNDNCQMPQINLTYTPSMLQHISQANMELNNAT